MTDKQTLKKRLKELELQEKENDVATSTINLRMRELDEVRFNHQHGLLVDASAGTFRLEDAVYSEVLSLGTSMQRWADRNPKKPLTLYIFSPGGSVLHGFALYDTLRTLSGRGHEITTVIRGYAGSMASVIFLAGDVRRIGAESLVHQHEVSSYAIGKASDLTDEVKFTQRLGDKIARIYVDRTNMTLRQFKAKTVKKEWYAEAQEALELGIATVVE